MRYGMNNNPMTIPSLTSNSRIYANTKIDFLQNNSLKKCTPFSSKPENQLDRYFDSKQSLGIDRDNIYIYVHITKQFLFQVTQLVHLGRVQDIFDCWNWGYIFTTQTFVWHQKLGMERSSLEVNPRKIFSDPWSDLWRTPQNCRFWGRLALVLVQTPLSAGHDCCGLVRLNQNPPSTGLNIPPQNRMTHLGCTFIVFLMTFDLPYGPNISWQEQADTLQIQRSGNLLEFAMQNDRFFSLKRMIYL